MRMSAASILVVMVFLYDASSKLAEPMEKAKGQEIPGTISGLSREVVDELQPVPNWKCISFDTNGIVSKIVPIDVGIYHSLSPDGSSVAFQFRKGIWVSDLKLPTPTRRMLFEFDQPGLFGPKVWDPSGNHIYTSLMRFDVKDKHWKFESYKVDVINARAEKFSLPETECIFDLSRDGKMFLTISSRRKSAGFQLYLYNSNGSEKSCVADSQVGFSARFSPDGQQIAYVSVVEKNTRVTLTHVNTTNKTIIAKSDVDKLYEAICWSPDSQWLAVKFHQVSSNIARKKTADELGLEGRGIEIISVISKSKRLIPLEGLHFLGNPEWR